MGNTGSSLVSDELPTLVWTVIVSHIADGPTLHALELVNTQLCEIVRRYGYSRGRRLWIHSGYTVGDCIEALIITTDTGDLEFRSSLKFQAALRRIWKNLEHLEYLRVDAWAEVNTWDYRLVLGRPAWGGQFFCVVPIFLSSFLVP